MPKGSTSRGRASRSASRVPAPPPRSNPASSGPPPSYNRVPGTPGSSFGAARAILRGELDKIGLPTLLTILEMERRSGILLLQQPRQLGRLYVRDGQIIRARVEGPLRRSGAEAVYQMLTWTDGQFELWQAEVEGRDEIRQRTTYLLMEGMRRQDEMGVELGVEQGVEPAVGAPAERRVVQDGDLRLDLTESTNDRDHAAPL